MTKKYNETCERLWEKLEYYRNEFDLNCVDLKKPFPLDQFEAKNPKIRQLINEVQNEFSYEMSERQCSWAVAQFLKINMQEYNKHNNLNLQARA